MLAFQASSSIAGASASRKGAASGAMSAGAFIRFSSGWRPEAPRRVPRPAPIQRGRTQCTASATCVGAVAAPRAQRLRDHHADAGADDAKQDEERAEHVVRQRKGRARLV